MHGKYEKLANTKQPTNSVTQPSITALLKNN